MISVSSPISALAAIAAVTALGLALVPPAAAAPQHRTVHRAAPHKVVSHKSFANKSVTRKMPTTHSRGTKSIKRVSPKTIVKPSTPKVTKTIRHTTTPKHATITKPTGITRGAKTVITQPVKATGFKTMKFKSGKTKVVHFSGQKGFRHKPSNFVKPSHIAHNPKHIAGLHGHHHHHRAFFFRHGGHRWHRWYYPLLAGGLWYWYWYDLPADNDPAVVSLADTAIPECDPEEDECVELDE